MILLYMLGIDTCTPPNKPFLVWRGFRPYLSGLCSGRGVEGNRTPPVGQETMCSRAPSCDRFVIGDLAAHFGRWGNGGGHFWVDPISVAVCGSDGCCG